ncbi:MAG TPA: PmoA family protein [Prolixibacteraceae bacterium]|nr:PmoA family protein [Prolixibacteraceae bacterium]
MKIILTFLAGLFFLSANAQELLKFDVSAGSTDRSDCPVSLSIDHLNYNTDSLSLALFEIRGKTATAIPLQLETASGARIWFVLTGLTPKNTKRTFVLQKSLHPQTFQTGISAIKKDGALNLKSGDKPILSYQVETVNPPAGISPFFRRSGFLHPVYSPEGEVLTRIQAPDHYHHYGIWNPWTLTFIGKREVDFWNLYKGQGTVRFAGLISQVEGPVYTGFRSLQEHIDFGAAGGDAIAMNELFDVRVWNLGNQRYMLDYSSTLNTPLDSGILLAAYRYGGGIGWRATEKWTKDNCSVLTSEGKGRKDADGSNARWCIVEGETATKAGRSGILFLSYPANRMHPEPMRVWPMDANGGRGDMFFEFCPIRHKEWKIEKGNDYTLKYRLIIFDGKMTPEEAENYWQAFANPPQTMAEIGTGKK